LIYCLVGAVEEPPSGLSTGGVIAIIVVVVIVLLLIAAVLIYFFIMRKKRLKKAVAMREMSSSSPSSPPPPSNASPAPQAHPLTPLYPSFLPISIFEISNTFEALFIQICPLHHSLVLCCSMELISSPLDSLYFETISTLYNDFFCSKFEVSSISRAARVSGPARPARRSRWSPSRRRVAHRRARRRPRRRPRFLCSEIVILIDCSNVFETVLSKELFWPRE